MPRVSDAHRAARRDQILAAALRCAAREGFHKTTMSAVIQESGLSAGAVYLYFKDKRDLIRTLASTAVGAMSETIDTLASEGSPVPPEEAVAAAARRVVSVGEERGIELTPLALQAWAEAARDPEVHAHVREEAGRIRAAWIGYAREAIAAGLLPADADPERVGRSLMLMIPGFILHRAILGELTPEEYAAGLADLRRPV